MDRKQRAPLRRVVEAARRLLEDDTAGQLEGVYGILPSGKVIDSFPGDEVVRARLLAVINHHRAGGMKASEAVDRLVRENAFTTLNRFVALKMAERRGLVPEVISNGLQSTGLVELAELAPGLRSARADGGFRVLLESIMDEMSIGLNVLMGRRNPLGLLWPSPKALEELLELLNDPELAVVWSDDEAIGWVFQYFNADEPAEMRKGSGAPTSSRELAVRNQFFTPQYVVELLTDNTLGHIWLEMRRGDSALRDRCEMLAIRPDEDPKESDRTPRDPRDLKILDPAVGSGHFLLYVYDLLESIYLEAWRDESWPKWEKTGGSLREDYATEADLRRAMPGLILEHNLFGIEIDPRAAQIAAMALWLRAQRSFNELGLKPTERPPITRANIVLAEPLPGDQALIDQLLEGIAQPVIRELVAHVWKVMELAGEAGSLLRADEEVQEALRAAQDEMAPLMQRMDADLWDRLEQHLQTAVEWVAAQAAASGSVSERLFAEDASHGLAYLELCRKRFDVVLMNPPFGDSSVNAKPYVTRAYPRTKNDLYAAFVERGLLWLCQGGRLGAITSRTGFFLKTFQTWREEVLLQDALPSTVADLGYGVMDLAMVEAAAYCLERTELSPSNQDQETTFIRVLDDAPDDKGETLRNEVALLNAGQAGAKTFRVNPKSFSKVPKSPFAYWVGETVRSLFTELPSFRDAVGDAQIGLSSKDDFRFVRLWWEPQPQSIPRPPKVASRASDPLKVVSWYKQQSTESAKWFPYAKGGDFSPYYADVHLLVNWSRDGEEIERVVLQRYPYLRGNAEWVLHRGSSYFVPGLTWPRRTTSRMSVRPLPAGCLFGEKGPVAFPSEPEATLALMQSSAFQGLVGMQLAAGDAAARSYEIGIIQTTPVPPADVLAEAERELAEAGLLAFQHASEFSRTCETDHNFVMPSLLLCRGDTLQRRCSDRLEAERRVRLALSTVQARIDRLCGSLYALNDDDLSALSLIFGEISSPEKSGRNDDNRCHRLRGSMLKKLAAELTSYFVGVAFGRWDVCVAVDNLSAESGRKPFDPLPPIPAGMLQQGGLPVAVAPAGYPLRVPEAGILVDDVGLDGRSPATDDLTTRVRDVIRHFFPGDPFGIERELLAILGADDLHRHFGSPSGFYAQHLKRYSASRRKAPIYWPLSTASGAYTVWLYYPRLTADTLYAVLNKHVRPKITGIEQRLAQLEAQQRAAEGRHAGALTREISGLAELRSELEDFRNELQRVAQLPYRPNLDDGVELTAAPLWRLFRHTPWRNHLENRWKELERGDYDWSHIAMAIWPDRVKAKCKTDLSLAIAHGLENLPETEND